MYCLYLFLVYQHIFYYFKLCQPSLNVFYRCETTPSSFIACWLTLLFACLSIIVSSICRQNPRIVDTFPPLHHPTLSLSPTVCAFLSNVFRTRMKLDDKASHNCMSLAHICPQHCSLAPSPGALNAIPHHVQCPTVSTAQSPISMTSTRPPSFLGDLHSYQDDGR